MYINTETITQLSTVLAALLAIGAVIWTIIKWFLEQNKQTKDIENLKTKQQEDINSVKEEQRLIVCALLACLDGLKQLNCNGAVTEMHTRLEKHINQKAHE